jgi:predicted Zn-dependent peptidase
MRKIYRTAVAAAGAAFGIGIFIHGGSQPAFGADTAPVSAAGTRGAVTGPAAEVLHDLADGVTRMTLSNGLRVVMYRRNNAPVFAGQTWVKVGGVDEVPGKTGAAHLLEHMAFKGTDKIGTRDYAKEKGLLDRLDVLMKARSEGRSSDQDLQELRSIYSQLSEVWVDNEFSRIYQRRGEVGLNAATAKDYTMYQIELPTVAFELWCWMESERVLHPVFRQFYKEREVVREERRMRTDDDPGGRLYEAMLATAYWNHPYRLPTIGWSSDIKNLNADDTRALQRTYYRPDNMVLSLVGDLDPVKVKPLLEKYFGRLPKATTELPEVTALEESQDGPRDVVVRFDAEPSLLMAYHKPVYPNSDDLYFSILHTLLAGGRSSIFFRELVLEKQLAVNIGTSEAPGELYPSVFYISATPRRGVSTLQLRDAIQGILDRVSKEGFPDDDFVSAKKRVKVGFLASLDSNDELAETLGHAELLWNDWRAVLKMYDIVNQATKEDVQSLIAKYLTVENRTFARIEKKEGAK